LGNKEEKRWVHFSCSGVTRLIRSSSIKDISARRTNKAKELIGELGGNLISGYALLGDVDLVLIVEFPGKEEAIKASVALSKMLEIGFTTAPAVTVHQLHIL
jgi:uncharacterized protein with GYD domain